ncbi:MAG: glycosyltransferase family 2 protein [Acidimicrobiales bacterium]
MLPAPADSAAAAAAAGVSGVTVAPVVAAALPASTSAMSDRMGDAGRDLYIDNVAAAGFAVTLSGRRLQPVVVVIAAYNEEDGIASVLRDIPESVCGLGVDTIVVVDGATDGTADAARIADAARNVGAVGAARVLVCDVRVNRGQGAALRLGYRLARENGAEYIATTDADGQYDPKQLPSIIEPLIAGRADFVSGSRRLGSAETTDRFRAAGVVVFAGLISVLTGRRITDPSYGMRAMRVDVAEAVTLRQPQFQATELLIGVAQRGFRIVEVPATIYRRSAGTSKKGHNITYGLRVGRVILATWWRGRGRGQATLPRSATGVGAT